MVQLVDNVGNITKEYSYDAFGVERNKDDNDQNPFRYTAEYYDKETGTIYLRMRYYIPHLGRFLTEDPIRDGLNWYTYANGNPIMFIDPMGLSAQQKVALREYIDKRLENRPMSYEIDWVEDIQTAILTLLWEDKWVTNFFTVGIDETELIDSILYVAKDIVDSQITALSGKVQAIEPVYDVAIAIIAIPIIIKGGIALTGVAKNLAAAAPATAVASEKAPQLSTRVSERMSNPGRAVPIQTIMNTIDYGISTSDPKGTSAHMYYSTMWKNEQLYNLEVLYNKATDTIWHVMYSRNALGPLPAIRR